MAKLLLLCLAFVLCAAQTDTSIPTWKEIRKILDYKESGNAAILYDTRLTSKIKNADPVDNITTVKKDSAATVWMKFLLPKDLEEKRFTLVISKGPLPVKTSELKLALKSNNGALIYRTWRTHTFTKTGTHTARIYFEETLVKELTFTVID